MFRCERRFSSGSHDLRPFLSGETIMGKDQACQPSTSRWVRLALVLVVGCALVGVYAASQLLTERSSESKEDRESIVVLVARSNLDLGQLIGDPRQPFDEKAFIKSKVPAAAFTPKDYAQLESQRLAVRLAAGEFVCPDNLVEKNRLRIGTYPGMKAVSIKVNIDDVVMGPGSLPMSRVDIVLILDLPEGETLAHTILENVLVLASDDNIERFDDRNPNITICVALTPDDAELLAIARELGSLGLIVRTND
jgi:Flp pilus assembly protein CpaB